MPEAPADAPLARDAYRRQRRIGDFYARARLGPAFHAAGVLILAVAGRYIESYWPLLGTWLLAYALLGFMRIRHRPPELEAGAAAAQAWWREHWVLEKIGCLFWAAALVGVGMIEGRPNTVFVIAVICTIAYATAVTDAFAMARRQAMVSVLLLIWPASVTLYMALPPLRSALLTLGVYSIYLLAYAWRRGGEYAAQIENELDLSESRAAVDRLARTDALTGLANRREYAALFEWNWQQAKRRGETLSMLVIDLDHFKQINDRHGHASGDTALIHVAEVLRAVFRRANDFVARIGGEEFVVLMPGAELVVAQAQAEAFRQQLQTQPCRLHGHDVVLTASVGVGSVDYRSDAHPDATFARIDRACYQAKQDGRNRVVAALPA